MQNSFFAVRIFHEVFGHPSPRYPRIQSQERAIARSKWIRDECDELEKAYQTENTLSWRETVIANQADAYIDIIYFALGGLVELGVNPQPLFDAVHAANMAKFQPDGSVKKDENGKVIKPDGWTPPDIEKLIRLQMEK